MNKSTEVALKILREKYPEEISVDLQILGKDLFKIFQSNGYGEEEWIEALTELDSLNLLEGVGTHFKITQKCIDEYFS